MARLVNELEKLAVEKRGDLEIDALRGQVRNVLRDAVTAAGTLVGHGRERQRAHTIHDRSPYARQPNKPVGEMAVRPRLARSSHPRIARSS